MQRPDAFALLQAQPAQIGESLLRREGASTIAVMMLSPSGLARIGRTPRPGRSIRNFGSICLPQLGVGAHRHPAAARRRSSQPAARKQLRARGVGFDGEGAAVGGQASRGGGSSRARAARPVRAGDAHSPAADPAESSRADANCELSATLTLQAARARSVP